MTLPPGTKLGAYEVLAPLGAGGMGEVFRARDARLHREVAIKGLPEAFAKDPERLARFEREARMLASLSHANIAAIYGIEDAGGAPFLVLELVEGESLAQRLTRGSLPLREALDVAGQIAAAMEAAHERGIVHRDLKPGNVMLTPARVVKVLDFGLAKGGATEGGAVSGLSQSPTMGAGATASGLVLGTASYMSPEQARGLAVDRRTDVWAFGCVVYECLTARQAFNGPTASDVIGRILEREPDWNALPPATPARLRDLLKRCLTKDVEGRPRDIGDLKRELGAIAQELSSPSGIHASSPGGVPSLAVLYFENLANDQESEYFCAGITEDILTDLSKIRGLRVASRNAVVRYKGGPTDIPKIAAELGVGAVLEGSVRRAGGRVRITAQLINAADGFHLWAERYDRTLEDVFAVQEEIAAAIAGALRVTLAPAEAANLARNRPEDVRAYDLYLKGRARYGAYTAASLHEAIALFTQATELDPNYALAWAGIADCYGQLNQWGEHEDRAELARLGLEAAERAMQLNPKLPEAYKAQALVLRFAGDIDGGRAALLRAVQADPRFAPALLNLCVDAYCLADVAGAERYVRRVLAIDPQDAFATIWLSLITIETSRSEEAAALARRVRTLSDETFYVTASYGIRTMIQLAAGDLDLAAQTIREGLADGAVPAQMHAFEAYLAALAGRADDARRMVKELDGTPALAAGALISAAAAALKVGETEIAVRILNRTVVQQLSPTAARIDPTLHAVLDQPPFAPRRRDATLVWPLEAPMIDRARFRLFKEVRIDTGLPEGSDVR
jgi:serine/threonine protein kinase/Tfp pilus assembly protein PilF